MRNESQHLDIKKLEKIGKDTVTKIMIPSTDKLINHAKALQKKKNQILKILFCLNQFNIQLTTSQNKINQIQNCQQKIKDQSNDEDKAYTSNEIEEIIKLYNQSINKVYASRKDQMNYSNMFYELEVRHLIADMIMNKTTLSKKENVTREENNDLSFQKTKIRKTKSVDHSNETNITSSVVTHNSSIGNLRNSTNNLKLNKRNSFQNKKLKSLSIESSTVSLKGKEKSNSLTLKAELENTNLSLKNAKKFCNKNELSVSKNQTMSIENRKAETLRTSISKNNEEQKQQKQSKKRASKSVEKDNKKPLINEENNKAKEQQMLKQKSIEAEKAKTKQKIKNLKFVQIISKFIKNHLKREEDTFLSNFKNKNKYIIKLKNNQKNLALIKNRNITKLKKLFKKQIFHLVIQLLNESSTAYINNVKQQKQELNKAQPSKKIKKVIPKTLTKPKIGNINESLNSLPKPIAPVTAKNSQIKKKDLEKQTLSTEPKSEIKPKPNNNVPQIKTETHVKVKKEIFLDKKAETQRNKNLETFKHKVLEKKKSLNSKDKQESSKTISEKHQTKDTPSEKTITISEIEKLSSDTNPENSIKLEKEKSEKQKTEEQEKTVIIKPITSNEKEDEKQEEMIKQEKKQEAQRQEEKIKQEEIKKEEIKQEEIKEKKTEIKEEAKVEYKNEDKSMDLLIDDDLSQFIKDNDFVNDEEDHPKEETNEDYQESLKKLKSITQETKDIELSMKEFMDKIHQPSGNLILVNS